MNSGFKDKTSVEKAVLDIESTRNIQLIHNVSCVCRCSSEYVTWHIDWISDRFHPVIPFTSDPLGVSGSHYGNSMDSTPRLLSSTCTFAHRYSCTKFRISTNNHLFCDKEGLE